MDLSALIFVALAVAWAVYLIPKALKHHDEVVRSRSVERFSATMRVLARREPISRRDARLVVTPGRHPSATTVETKASSVSPTQPSYAARRAAAAKATKRRRNVLGLVLLVNAVVIGLAVVRVLVWPSVAVPAGLLVAWLVACRVMVKGERAAARPARTAAPAAAAPDPVASPLEIIFELPETVDSPVVEDVPAPLPETAQAARAEGAEPMRAEGAWDMVPTTLPTYVSKAPAVRRTVQTIDLDSTGVWSSGRNEDDSALAREAEKSERTARAAADERRASGS
ncbi:MAG: hypothetical protein ABIR39_03380 [Nocardioides sp.]|uniref:divisome protein SepX/GlpR n=1 Tax=Nocardioides sp. TaxID=35761 RepID=UPI003263F8C6